MNSEIRFSKDCFKLMRKKDWVPATCTSKLHNKNPLFTHIVRNNHESLCGVRTGKTSFWKVSNKLKEPSCICCHEQLVRNKDKVHEKHLFERYSK